MKRAKEIAATLALVAFWFALVVGLATLFLRLELAGHEPAEPSTCFVEERGTVCP